MKISERVEELKRQIMTATQVSVDYALTFTHSMDLLKCWEHQSEVYARWLLGVDFQGQPLGDPATMGEKAARCVIGLAYRGDPPVDFWATAVGRHVWRCGGFPPRGATRYEAAEILGISHQGITYLINQGRLHLDEHKRIHRGELYAHWQSRQGANLVRGLA